MEKDEKRGCFRPPKPASSQEELKMGMSKRNQRRERFYSSKGGGGGGGGGFGGEISAEQKVRARKCQRKSLKERQ